MPVRSSKADPGADWNDRLGDNPLRRTLGADANTELHDPHLYSPRQHQPDVSRTLLVDPGRSEEMARIFIDSLRPGMTGLVTPASAQQHVCRNSEQMLR